MSRSFVFTSLILFLVKVKVKIIYDDNDVTTIIIAPLFSFETDELKCHSKYLFKMSLIIN